MRSSRRAFRLRSRSASRERVFVPLVISSAVRLLSPARSAGSAAPPPIGDDRRGDQRQIVLLDDDHRHAVGELHRHRRGERRDDRLGRVGHRDAIGIARGLDDLDIAGGLEVGDRDGVGDGDLVALRPGLRHFGGHVADRRRAVVGQIAPRDALDVGGGHARDRGELLVGRRRIAVDDHRPRDRRRLAVGGLAAFDRRGEQLVLGARQFGGRDQPVADARDLGAQRRLAGRHVLAVGHRRDDDERCRCPACCRGRCWPTARADRDRRGPGTAATNRRATGSRRARSAPECRRCCRAARDS